MRHAWFTLIISLPGLLFSCSTGPEQITNKKDYEQFMIPGKTNRSKSRANIEDDLKFWSKRLNFSDGDLTSQIKVAGLLSKHFSYSGDINELHKADSLYRKANQIQKKFSSALYRSLATNDVTQHQFKQALPNLDSALKIGDDKNLTLLQRFDVELELGNILLARQLLNRVSNKNSFEFLVRNAKLMDHSGRLDEAIGDMEKALSEVKLTGNKSMYCWTLANLGDMYSHANRFEKAYRTYLKVLREDGNYFHALKGIAWLAFSHDKNTNAAKKILHYLEIEHPVPDYDLILAKIASFENDLDTKNKLLEKFVCEVSRNEYGKMYNNYLFDIYADEWNKINKALEIAQLEISNRPTPYSYHLLSWALFKSGRIEEAETIAAKKVLDKCFEPNVLLRLGIIFSKSGKQVEATRCLKAARESSFELGPCDIAEVEKQIN